MHLLLLLGLRCLGLIVLGEVGGVGQYYAGLSLQGVVFSVPALHLQSALLCS